MVAKRGRSRLNLRTLTKIALRNAGARSAEKTLHFLNGLFDYVELGWWLRRNGFTAGRRTASCPEVAGAVASAIGDRPSLYLQFGAEDESMVLRWARELRDPETKLYVFDVTDARHNEWLPARGRGHSWAEPRRKRATDGGAAARAEDGRIQYARGSLADLLGTVEIPPEPRILVAVFDTDHYGTTKGALDFLRTRLPDETYLFFDQLNHRADELRAFHEFLQDSGFAFEVLARNRESSCMAFRRIR